MRIDKYLSKKFGSRTKAAHAIESGLVLVNGKVVNPSFEVNENDDLVFLEAEESYVSLGGFKLAKALKDFDFDVCGKIFADIGASTGGFTDCLFQRGASKVYCVDVGESQLDLRLKSKNIVIYDNFNARNLEKSMFEENLDGAVIDVSFISLTYILDKVAAVLDDGKHVIALIKPQFECESRNVGKNGIVKDGKIREKIIEKIYNFAVGCKLAPKKLTTAPYVKGKNIEYLILLEKCGVPADIDNIKKSVNL